MNEQKLISKKDTLETMGISYGQLYRWKRKGLIPESWFIRRSTFTGQETFFPEEKILARIERILSLKENCSLDQLATRITEKVDKKLEVAFSKLRELGWLDKELMEPCGVRDEEASVALERAFSLGVLHEVSAAGRKEEIGLVKRTLDLALADSLVEHVREQRSLLHLLRKRVGATGISAEISIVVIAPDGATFDPDIESVHVVDLAVVLDKIKLNLIKEEK